MSLPQALSSPAPRRPVERRGVAYAAVPLASVAIVAGLIVATARAEELPVSRPWQRTLRDHLATLTEVEFDVEQTPVRRDTEALDDEGLYRDWLLLGSALDRLPDEDLQPDISVLGRPAADYRLAAIEADGGVWMNVKRHSPMGAAWWAGWSYPGNPWHGSRAVTLRGYVPAAVDMIMMAEAPEPVASETLALHLLGDTYAYLQAIDILPADVRAAFQTAIGESLGRLEAAGPTSAAPSQGLAAVTACAYVARAADDPALTGRAEALARRVVDERFRPAGYVEVEGGCDPAAEGGASYYLAWAAVVAPGEWEFLRTALARASDLRGCLMLPEPHRGVCHGPTHFAPTPGADSFQDDSGLRSRDVTAAMLTGPGLCFLFNDRPRRGGPAAPLNRGRMETQIDEAFTTIPGRRSINAALASSAATTPPRARWDAADLPVDHVPFDHDYFLPGSLARFRRAAPLPIAKLPFRRETDFARGFDEEFMVARLGDSGVVVHTGRIAAGREPIGFSGGALSAYWTPSTGPVILGRRDAGNTADTWDAWWRWQTHALAGTGAEGAPFSTARIPRGAFTEIVHEIARDRATVRVSAPLHERGTGGNDAVAEGALAGDVTYSRRFDVDGSGLRIETRITGDGSDRVTRLCEILPVFDDAPVEGASGPAVEASVYVDTGAGWRPAEARPTPGVRRIRIDRQDGAVEIEFDRPQRAGLAPMAGVTGQNILVELLERDGESKPLESFGVSYTIRPLLTRR